ncbi:unnamed protein product [Pleuronectes platessa]|uniref:Uncharacterized protein n=1 Tax=Pleuronectes platessa TaxID=8262 RepID=A0A9N7ULF3_PLEPL|nr:unnamed protein product [Pleuronectes platessa]
MSAARKALRGASERHGEGVPRWRGRSYLSVSVKTQKHTLAFTSGQYVDREGSVGRRRRQEVRRVRGSLHRTGRGVAAAAAKDTPPLTFFKPGQEAGTAAAAGQVARQPERELATAPEVTGTRSKTRNREEENPDMVVMWGVLDN